jgi:urocanate hydratase
MARHVGFMLEMKKRGSITFDYGNNLREFARQGGEEKAFSYNGFVPNSSDRFSVKVKVLSDGWPFQVIRTIF